MPQQLSIDEQSSLNPRPQMVLQKRCRRCGTPLRDDNWYPADRTGHHNTCINCKRDYGHKQYLIHRDEAIRRTKVWSRTHVPQRNRISQRYRQTIKLEVMQHYSGKVIPECANPYGQHKEPYTDIRALSIDHIEGGGTRHLKTIGSGTGKFYAWLKRNHFPPNFRVLCMNCQFISKTESINPDKATSTIRQGGPHSNVSCS